MTQPMQCRSCGSTKTQAEFDAAGAITCCPERTMNEVIERDHGAPALVAAPVPDEIGDAIDKAIAEYEAELDTKFGAGKWHCDDIIENLGAGDCVLSFLAYHRAPAYEQNRGELKDHPRPNLYATYEGQRVRVTMASRFGDVGIAADLTTRFGYSKRVYVPELSDFSDKP